MRVNVTLKCTDTTTRSAAQEHCSLFIPLQGATYIWTAEHFNALPRSQSSAGKQSTHVHVADLSALLLSDIVKHFFPI